MRAVLLVLLLAASDGIGDVARWETSGDVDDVLGDGGEYGTTYPIDELAEHAPAAARASCGSALQHGSR